MDKIVTSDPVNNPTHYNSGAIEVIDVIEDQLGIGGLKGFCKGNALKYIMRSGKKGGSEELEIQDLEKAAWYLNHYIKRIKQKQQEEK